MEHIAMIRGTWVLFCCCVLLLQFFSALVGSVWLRSPGLTDISGQHVRAGKMDTCGTYA